MFLLLLLQLCCYYFIFFFRLFCFRHPSIFYIVYPVCLRFAKYFSNKEICSAFHKRKDSKDCFIHVLTLHISKCCSNHFKMSVPNNGIVEIFAHFYFYFFFIQLKLNEFAQTLYIFLSFFDCLLLCVIWSIHCEIRVVRLSSINFRSNFPKIHLICWLVQCKNVIKCSARPQTTI